MKNNKLASAISTLLITSALTACGGGDGTNPDNNAIGTNVTSSGIISQFGSVYVNGVRYATRNSQIISSDDGSVLLDNPTDDQVKTILGLGQVITVRGTRNDDGTTGTANTIRFDNELVGDVSTVSNTDGSFVILGQTISVTPETIIDDSIIELARANAVELADDLAFGDASLTESLSQLLNIGTTYVVSGFPSQNGFEATRIEDIGLDNVGFIGNGSEVEVKGTVKNLDTTLKQFELNGLTVSYEDSDLDSEDFASVSLTNDQFVEVHGSSSSATQMDATKIELEDRIHDDDYNEGEFEVEGVVQKIVADLSGTGGVITINGIEIQVDDISQFSEGLRIEIKGRLESNGSISISRIKDEAEDTVRIKDNVDSSLTTGTSFTTRLGIEITPTDRSRLEDDSVDDDDNLNISGFLSSVGSKSIEARGFPLDSTTVWTRLEIEDDINNDCRLRGPVSAINGDVSSFTFSIQGVTVDVSSVSDANFENGANLSIGKTAFFNQLTVGDVVQATSDKAGNGCTNGNLGAREVEFEPVNNVLFGSSTDDSSSSSSTTNDNELVGSASNITDTSFDLAGSTITVTDSTIIDDSIIEDARGVEINTEDSLGNLPETLSELISNGMGLEVVVQQTANGLVAVSIEDL